MPNFTKTELEIRTNQDADPRVVKQETPVARDVQSFDLPKLKQKGQGTYAATKGRFGALAATDTDRASRKGGHFNLNSLVRDPLAVDAEEQRVIEERVNARVAAASEEARKAAAQDGYRDGLAKGHEEAFLKFRGEATERLARLEDLIAGFEGAKTEILRANERFVMELVYRIARMICLRELSTDKDFVLRLTRSLIERIGVRDNIRVQIHPDDAASVGMLKEGLEKSLGALKNLNIETSDTVERGGCQVETEWNAIDASVETQLKGIYDSLIGEGPAPAQS